LRAGRKSVRIVAIFASLFRYFSRLDQTNFSRFRRTLSLISTVGFAIFTIPIGDVSQGKLITINNYFELFNTPIFLTRWHYRG